jgi:hypothetical protein
MREISVDVIKIKIRCTKRRRILKVSEFDTDKRYLLLKTSTILIWMLKSKYLSITYK